MSPESFIYFPSLPTELRLNIWHHTFLPRLIDHGLLYDYYCSHPPPPSTLLTNHESRTLTLSLYIPVHTRQTEGRLCRLWISPTIDTMCIPLSIWPDAPNFRQLAAENAELHERTTCVSVQCGSLKRAKAYIDLQVQKLKAPGCSVVYEDASKPLLAWRMLEVVLFDMYKERVAVELRAEHEAGKEGGAVKNMEMRDFKGFLEAAREWYFGMGKHEKWADMKVPRVLRVVGKGKVVLGELVDGLFVAPINTMG